MNLPDYIKGRRKGKAARRIEIEAMRDPFLAEAIEGFDAVGGDHAALIEAMQKQVSARTRQRSKKIWLPLSGAVAAAVTVLLYLTVFDGTHSTQQETGLLSLYLPDEYVEKKQLTAYNTVSPTVEITNIDLLDPVPQLEIYVPDEYVEKKKQSAKHAGNLQSTQAAKRAQSSSSAQKPQVLISNLDELFMPEEPIEIYLPEGFLTKEKQNTPTRVQIDNILY